MHIYKLKEIDLARVCYSKPRGKGDRQAVLISYDDPKKGKQPLVFQTPELKNVNKLEKKGKVDGLVYYDLDIPLYTDNTKNQKQVAEFVDFLKRLDAKLVEDGRKFSTKWFSGKDNVRYKSVIRRSSVEDDVHKNGLVRLKLLRSKDFNTLVFNDDKDPVDPETSIKTEGCYLTSILEFAGLWVNKDGGYGPSIRPTQMRVTYRQPNKYSFIEDSDEDTEYNCDDICGDTEIDPTSSIGLRSRESHRETREPVLNEKQQEKLVQAELTEVSQTQESVPVPVEKEIIILENKTEPTMELIPETTPAIIIETIQEPVKQEVQMASS